MKVKFVTFNKKLKKEKTLPKKLILKKLIVMLEKPRYCAFFY